MTKANTTPEIRMFAQALLHSGCGPLSAKQRRVIERIARDLHVRNLNREVEDKLTFGERVADKVALWGGSWAFIFSSMGLLAVWVVINSFLLIERAFDPYPYVFLNLILSMIAALQAPVVMMSQNRQASKDRTAASIAYEVTLRNEIEIAALHEKLDTILNNMSTAGTRSAYQEHVHNSPGVMADEGMEVANLEEAA